MHSVLAQSLREGRAGISYLISGSSASNVDREARAYLRALFCETKTGCGKCPGCRKADSQEHVDLQVIEGLGVEDVRSLGDFVHRHPFEGNVKAVYITRADLLSEQAQNAVLKLVEEPPPDTVFVLGAVNRRTVLPTILSRCTQLEAAADGSNALERITRGANVENPQAALLLRAAEGDYDGAMQLYEDGYLEIRDRAAEAMHRLLSARNMATSRMENLLWEEKGGLEVSLRAALQYLQDAVARKYLGEGAAMINEDIATQLDEDTKASPRRLTAAVDGLSSLLERMGSCRGLNRRLALQSTLLKILEESV